jgi:glutaredoxin-like protein NrdH
MNVHVYTTGPACQKCAATKRVLRNAGVQFTEVNIREDAAGAEYVAGLGHVVAPVVVVLDEYATIVNHWSDHRTGHLDSLVKELAA